MADETFKCKVLAQTEKAVKIRAHHTTEWIPRVHIISLNVDKHRDGTITIPYWKFEQLFGE